jgi:hypothetical protein
MTITLRAVPTGGTGGGGSTAPASNRRGEVSGLAPGATTTLVSGATAQWKLRGFVAFGDNDGVVWVEVDGVPLAGITARMSRVKTAMVIMPNPEQLVGTTVALKVRNEADLLTGVAGTYEGTLLGE